MWHFLKEHEPKIKTWTENSTRSTNDKYTNISKKTKIKGNAATCWDKKEKSNTRKNGNITRGSKLKSSSKRKKIKKILRKGRTYRPNSTFQNNERKLYQQVGGEAHGEISTTRYNGN